MTMTASEMARRKWERMTETQRARHMKRMASKRWKNRKKKEA